MIYINKRTKWCKSVKLGSLLLTGSWFPHFPVILSAFLPSKCSCLSLCLSPHCSHRMQYAATKMNVRSRSIPTAMRMPGSKNWEAESCPEKGERQKRRQTEKVKSNVMEILTKRHPLEVHKSMRRKEENMRGMYYIREAHYKDTNSTQGRRQ